MTGIRRIHSRSGLVRDILTLAEHLKVTVDEPDRVMEALHRENPNTWGCSKCGRCCRRWTAPAPRAAAPLQGVVVHPLTTANVALHNMEQRHRAEKDALLLGRGYLADVSESMVVAIDPALIRVTDLGTPMLIEDLGDKLEARNIRAVPPPPELKLLEGS